MRLVRAIALYGLLVASVRAELPLTIEDLLSDKGQIKVETSFTYANSEHTGVEAADPILIQTGPASFVLLPSRVGCMELDTDTLPVAGAIRMGS